MPAIEATPSPFTDELPEDLKCGLNILKRANLYSKECGRSTWDFAVEIHVLCAVGLGTHDLRWMICKGLIEHATEVADSQDGTRSFRPSGKLSFTDKTCFVLSESCVAGAWDDPDGAKSVPGGFANTN